PTWTRAANTVNITHSSSMGLFFKSPSVFAWARWSCVMFAISPICCSRTTSRRKPAKEAKRKENRYVEHPPLRTRLHHIHGSGGPVDSASAQHDADRGDGAFWRRLLHQQEGRLRRPPGGNVAQRSRARSRPVRPGHLFAD